MSGYDTVIFGTTALNVTSMVVKKIPSTIKQKIGRILVSVPVIGRDSLEYEFDITGYITGNSLSVMETKRDKIESYNDVKKYHFQTGINSHTGSYIMVPDSLSWTENSDDAQSRYVYKFTIKQYNQ